MMENSQIFIRRNWTNYKIGSVKLSQLDHIHWDNVSGGTQQRTNRYYIHAYVRCDVIQGEIDHSCNHGEGPHHIKVCILKKDNNKEVFLQLLIIAGPKPDNKKAPSGADGQLGDH